MIPLTGLTRFAEFARLGGLTPIAWLSRAAVLGILSTTSASAFGSGPAPHLLAVDDARGCALGPQGEVVGATAGGLVIAKPGEPTRVLTALDGLGETQVDRVRVEGRVAHVEGRTTQSEVALDTGRVQRVTRMVPRPFSAPEPRFEQSLFSGAEVRMTAEQRGSRCWATDAGLYAGVGGAKPTRLMAPSLPTGDVAAIAAGAERLFVGTFDRGLFVAGPDGRVEPLRNPAVHSHVNALAWDEPRDTLWIGTARGLVRCSMAGQPHCQRVGGAGAIHAILVLDDGRTVAGGDAGLTLLDAAGRVEWSLGHKQGAPFSAVWALAATSETLFIGTTRGLFYGPWDAFRGHAAEGPWGLMRRVSAITGNLAEDWVTALAVDDAELVVGLYHSGIVAFSTNGPTLRRVRSDASLGYVNPGGIVPVGGGRFALATMDGLRVGKLGALHRVPTLASDVTGVTRLGGTYYVATRRGVQSWSGDTEQSR